MTPSANTFTDDLLQHAASLRSLASELVAGPDRAEDIVQDTYLRALKSPPRDRRGLWPWLSTVLRNVARNEHRGDRRRVRREALVATDEVVVGATDDDAPHAETLHRLTSALRDLPEPYRSTLTERYFSGLTPTEMARRFHTPLPTVKARLARGLELLRRDLSAGSSESDWRTGLVVAVGLPPASAGITRPALPALLLMAPTTKLIFGIATAATAVAAIWWLLHDLVPAAPLHSNANKQAEVQSARLDTIGAQASRERVLAEARIASPRVEMGHPYSFTLRCLALDSDGLRCTDA
ncbi:MAG: RNA polymerase sigma-70 factor (ECF subfamily), partial [Neolewinella sp.]